MDELLYGCTVNSIFRLISSKQFNNKTIQPYSHLTIQQSNNQQSILFRNFAFCSLKNGLIYTT